MYGEGGWDSSGELVREVGWEINGDCVQGGEGGTAAVIVPREGGWHSSGDCVRRVETIVTGTIQGGH